MGSFPNPPKFRSSTLLETSCGYLLQELKLIWDEIGENQLEREKILLEMEQECLEVYRRKVDAANISRARLHQALADSEAEFTHLLVSLGERSLPGRPEKMAGTLKEQLDAITPALREMQLRKEERMNQFRDVQMQIQKISAEISGQSDFDISSLDVMVNEGDLSLKRLEEYQNELQQLHKEKEKKRVQVQLIVEQEKLLASRLNANNRYHSNRSTNGGFGSAAPLNRRLSMGIQQIGSNSINSPTQGISFIKESKMQQRQNMFTRQGRTSQVMEDTASVVSATYSGPLSP